MTAAERLALLDSAEPSPSAAGDACADCPFEGGCTTGGCPRRAKVRMAVLSDAHAEPGKPYAVQLLWPGRRPVGGEFES